MLLSDLSRYTRPEHKKLLVVVTWVQICTNNRQPTPLLLWQNHNSVRVAVLKYDFNNLRQSLLLIAAKAVAGPSTIFTS